MSYTFGCTAVEGKTGWLVQNSSISKSSQEALALDNVGEPVVAHYYQKIDEMSFEVVLPDDASSIPEVGDVFTYESVKYYVVSVQVARVNTDFVRHTLTCRHFVANNLPA
jgi:extradiol dioxygenase family protein